MFGTKILMKGPTGIHWYFITLIYLALIRKSHLKNFAECLLLVKGLFLSETNILNYRYIKTRHSVQGKHLNNKIYSRNLKKYLKSIHKCKIYVGKSKWTNQHWEKRRERTTTVWSDHMNEASSHYDMLNDWFLILMHMMSGYHQSMVSGYHQPLVFEQSLESKKSRGVSWLHKGQNNDLLSVEMKLIYCTKREG